MALLPRCTGTTPMFLFLWISSVVAFVGVSLSGRTHHPRLTHYQQIHRRPSLLPGHVNESPIQATQNCNVHKGNHFGTPQVPNNKNRDETAVPCTPCARICRYNSNVMDGHVCIGCFRETFEIASWSAMSAMERYYVLLDAMDRKQSVQSDSDSQWGTESSMDDSSTTIQELQRQADYWKSQSEVCKG